MLGKRLGGYGLAVGCLLAASVLQLSLGSVGVRAPFLFLLTAVAITSFHAGFRPAMLGTVLAVVLANALLLDWGPGFWTLPARAAGSLVFMGVALWLAWLVTTRRSATQSLRDDEERMRLLFSQMPGKIWTTDRDLRITSMQGGSSLSGWSPAAAVGTTLYDRAAGRGDEYRPLSAHQRALAGVPTEYEHCPRGTDRSIAARVEPLRDSKGEIVGTVGVAFDITERKRMEETLRRYELLAAHSRDIILLMDRDNGRILEANAAAVQAYGYTREELLELTIHDLQAPDTATFTARQMEQADAEGILFETVHRRKDGQTFPVEVSSSGATIGERRTLIGVVRDITERRRTEEANEASLAQLRAVLGSMTEALVIADLEGNVLSCNAAALRMSGLTAQDEACRNLSELPGTIELLDIAGNPIPIGEWPLARAIRGEVFTGQELRVRRRDTGREFVGSFNGTPVRNRDGKPILAITTIHDITEEKRAEEALRQSEQRFRAIFDNAGVGMLEADTDDRFIAANDRVCQILGYSREELLSMNVHELTAPDDRSLSDRLNAELHEGVRDRIDYEKRYRKRDGSPLWVHVTVSPIRDDEGRWLRSIATVEDISARQAAVEKLQRSETQLRTIVENLSEGLVVSDLNGNLVHWNRAALDMHGFDSHEEARRRLGEFVGIFELSSLEGDVLPVEQWPLARLLRGERLRDWEVRIRRLGSDWQRVFSYGGTLVNDAGGQPLLAVVTIVDITERKRNEQALRTATLDAERAKAVAEEANRAKDNFLAVLSHELRTPLTPVLAGISMLQKERRVPPDAQGTLDMIRRNVELEARLIDDLLDLTRIARGKVELDKRPVELCTVIQRAIEVCLPDIKARNLHFGVEIADGPHTVEADAARLQQVFWNLLKNAVKFTPVGGCVGVRCTRDAEDRVAVQVSDSGEGIAPEFLTRLFNAFEQGDAGTAKRFGGLGLGLAISRSLVEMHQGTIEAHSMGKGKGSTFLVRLPLIPAAARGPQPVDAPARAAGPATRTLRILYVEDHGDTAELMASLLEFEGHRVQTAGDVATALDLAGRDSFDVLVSDLGLPDGSGIDLMRQLRARGQALPAIAVSGYGQDQDIRQSREAGFAAHVVKPVSVDQLLDVLAQVANGAG